MINKKRMTDLQEKEMKNLIAKNNPKITNVNLSKENELKRRNVKSLMIIVEKIKKVVKENRLVDLRNAIVNSSDRFQKDVNNQNNKHVSLENKEDNKILDFIDQHNHQGQINEQECNPPRTIKTRIKPNEQITFDKE